jgi:CO dehydrogenase maturation factor
MSLLVAVAGKGGVGKTTLSALIVRALHREEGKIVLAVDADPNSNLGEKLGATQGRTVGELREELMRMSEDSAGVSKQDIVRYQLQMAKVEGDGFDLISMGRPEGPGCYCYINNMLRLFIDEMSGAYDHVVIDNEAGMEHLSRRTTRRMDVLLLVSDSTPTGVRTARRLKELAEEMRLEVGRVELLVNRAMSLGEGARAEAEAAGVARIHFVPEDASLSTATAEGGPLAGMSGPAYEAVLRALAALRGARPT